jgi:hypothetical protein
MAARNRGRPGPGKDAADEENSLWEKIRGDAKRVDAMLVRIAYYREIFTMKRSFSCDNWILKHSH